MRVLEAVVRPGPGRDAGTRRWMLSIVARLAVEFVERELDPEVPFWRGPRVGKETRARRNRRARARA